jgi:WD40 repeat protein
MTKTIYIDGVWTILHLNSGREGYHAALQLGPFEQECCFCHLKVKMPRMSIGEQRDISCSNCHHKIVYLTVTLSEPLARVLDVRGGSAYGSPLGTGGIMHITLPSEHPEFDQFVRNPVGFQRADPNELIFFSEVINQTREILRAEVEDRVNNKKSFNDAENLSAIYYSLSLFGKIIIPGISQGQPVSSGQDCEETANKLITDLMKRYPGKLSEPEKVEIYSKILNICFNSIMDWLDSTKAIPQMVTPAPAISAGPRGSTGMGGEVQISDERTIQAHSKPVQVMTFLTENEIVLGGDDNDVALWNVISGNRIRAYKYHTGKLLQANRIDPDHFITSAEDGFLYCWEKGSGKITRSLDIDEMTRPPNFSVIMPEKTCVPHLAVDPGCWQAILLLVGLGPMPPYLWKIDQNGFYLLGGADQIPCGLSAAAFANEGIYAIYTSNCAVFVFNMVSGKIIDLFGGIAEAYLINNKQNMMFPFQGSDFGNIVGQGTFGWHSKRITCVDFSPDDEFFITGSEDETVRLWDFEDTISHKHSMPLVFEGLKCALQSVAFLHDGEWILGAGRDGTIIIWEIKSRKIIKKLALIDKPILSFSISPSRQRFAVGSFDGSAHIWTI